MKIYWIKAQAPRRVLALVKYLNIDAEFIEMNLMSGEMKKDEYQKLNPNMKAPTLVDGNVVLWESFAIMAYLANMVNSNMWPVNNVNEQIEILKWLSWNDHHWEEAVSANYFEYMVKSTYGFGEIDQRPIQAAQENFVRFGKVLNDHLKGRDFIACDRLTIVDFQLASMATDWKESKMPMEQFTHIVSWIDRLLEIPAWKNPWPNSKYALR